MMRDLKDVLAHFGKTIKSLMVKDLRIDSREVKEGDVFVALDGHQAHGAQFIDAALNAGAVCALVNTANVSQIHDERVIGVDNLEDQIAALATEFYRKPSSAIQLIGVTGTNGKSTTTALIANLATLCEHAGAVIGTLGYGKPDDLAPLANTTPSHVDLARILNELKEEHQIVAMEVSSHGLSQGRVDGLEFDVGVFTNLSRDHLDYHGDMASYADAKLQLFKKHQPTFSVINADDAIGQTWIKNDQVQSVVGFGRMSAQLSTLPHFVAFQHEEYTPDGIHCEFVTSWGTCQIVTSLYGEFNLYNLAAAFATLLSLGYEFDALARAVSSLQTVAGRMQPFSVAGKPTCIVDYAHTPDALEQALKALQQHVPGKVTCVFGCGGDRDKGKRPQMAAIAQKYADKVIVTSDNPRTESPIAIIDDILAGFTSLQGVHVESDRARAIASAIAMSAPDSVVLIAGKGHEDYQIIGKDIVPFCDRKVVQAFLAGESL